MSENYITILAASLEKNRGIQSKEIRLQVEIGLGFLNDIIEKISQNIETCRIDTC